MEDNGANYNYTKIDGFQTQEIHNWNVSCSASGYEELNGSDNISIVRGFSGNCGNVNFDSWNFTIGGSSSDYGESIIQTSDCNIVVAGSTNNYGAGNYDFWLIKIDENGNQLWNKTFGGDQSDRAYKVIEANNSDIIVAGYTYSFGEGNSDFWLLRLDNEGNQLWNKTFGGVDNDESYSVIESNNLDLVLVGSTVSYSNNSNSEGWVLRLDNEGNQLWNKTFGDNWTDIFYDVIEVNGELVLAGQITLQDDSSPYPEWPYSWIVHIDNSGNLIKQEYNTTSGVLYSLHYSSNDEIIAVGRECNKNSGFVPPDIWNFWCTYEPMTLRFNSSYDFINSQNYDFLTSHSLSTNSFYDVIENSKNQYVAVGKKSSTSTNSVGSIGLNSNLLDFWYEFTSGTGTTNTAKSLIQLASGNYIYAGYRWVTGNNDDLFVYNFEIPETYNFSLDYEASYSFYSETNVSVLINLENTGTVLDNYTIEILDNDSIDYLDILDPNMINLEPENNESFNITLNGDIGSYNIVFNISSENNNSVYQEVSIEFNLTDEPGVLSVNQITPSSDTSVLNKASFNYTIVLYRRRLWEYYSFIRPYGRTRQSSILYRLFR
jgi:hypothetical protein